jgi:hypothetical protein
MRRGQHRRGPALTPTHLNVHGWLLMKEMARSLQTGEDTTRAKRREINEWSQTGRKEAEHDGENEWKNEKYYDQSSQQHFRPPRPSHALRHDRLCGVDVDELHSL